MQISKRKEIGAVYIWFGAKYNLEGELQDPDQVWKIEDMNALVIEYLRGPLGYQGVTGPKGDKGERCGCKEV